MAMMSLGNSSNGTAWMPNQPAVLYVYVVIASIAASLLVDHRLSLEYLDGF